MSMKKKYEPIDPLAATESLGFQTHRRGARKPWTRQEDEALIHLIGQMHPDTTQLDPETVKWDALAEQLSPDGLRKPKDLRKRWCNSLDPSLRRGRWTKEEDDMLVNAYKTYDANWQRVAKEIPGRTDDQCAKRYLEVLDPETKDRLRPWSREEDLKLIRQVKLHGTKWRTVCLDLKGRPSLTCRNRWRKIVTDVVRGTADAYVEEEVRAITSNDNTLKDDRPIPKSEMDPPRPRKENTVPPAPPLGAKPASSNIDWRYSLELTRATPADPELPHRLLFDNENGGAIKNEQLVQALISYAKSHHLEITVHQHIHHHYSSQVPQDVGLSGLAIPNLNILNQISPPQFDNLLLSPIGSNPVDTSRNYELEVKRHQHFNYLPPLTEVPKLNSSNTLPALGQREMRSPPDPTRDQGLYRLLNNKQKDNLTPLTRAVEMASAVEANDQLRTNNSLARSLQTDRGHYKRQKYEPSEEEEIEEGPDFWETMRNLTEVQQRQVSQEPVSAHHPLHYQGSSTPQPTPQFNYSMMSQAQPAYDEEEDMDMFYETRRDGTATSSDPSMYDSIIQGYGVIPFNPS